MGGFNCHTSYISFLFGSMACVDDDMEGNDCKRAVAGFVLHSPCVHECVMPDSTVMFTATIYTQKLYET